MRAHAWISGLSDCRRVADCRPIGRLTMCLPTNKLCQRAGGVVERAPCKQHVIALITGSHYDGCSTEGEEDGWMVAKMVVRHA